MQSCEYAEIGFLSRRMRDGHIECSHQKAKSQAMGFLSNPDVDELQPLFFDLIRLDKVETVESIMGHFDRLNCDVRIELKHLVASSGSASMARVLFNESVFIDNMLNYCTTSIKAMNFETLRWFLSNMGRLPASREYSIKSQENFLEALVQSGSLKIFQECKELLINLPPLTDEQARYMTDLYFKEQLIRDTARNVEREQVLLSIWAASGMRNTDTIAHNRLGEALRNVARTTCSIALTKALLESGANVNYQSKSVSLTPLEQAARHDSPQAAELMKFLLYHGADPKIHISGARVNICDQKGPKNIAKWIGCLGTSWS